jgi:hypothetical protein
MAGANVELDALRTRVAGAMQRIDELLERLPVGQADEAPAEKA